MLVRSSLVLLCMACVKAAEPVVSCRYRSNHLRQDGGLCFEIPPWQHKPVVLEEHLNSLRERWNMTAGRRQLRSSAQALANSDFVGVIYSAASDTKAHPPTMVSPLKRRHTMTMSILKALPGVLTFLEPKRLMPDDGRKNKYYDEISRYMDTVLAPFLDTYHRNIQNSYQQLTGKILRRIKEEINAAIQKKQQIYTELTQLADDLKVPAMCDEERRDSRTLASKHVASIYACTEEARGSIAKMGKYAEEMIEITRNHMQATLSDATKNFKVKGAQRTSREKPNVTSCLQELSRAAVVLGYELDLSLTNARRHNEQSCEKLTSCTSKARKHSDEAITALKDQLYQCVYA